MKFYTLIASAVTVSLLGGCANMMGMTTAEQQAKIDATSRTQNADRMVLDKLASSTESIAGTLQMIERIERGNPTTRSTGAQASTMAQPPLTAQSSDVTTSKMSGSNVSGTPGYANDMLDTRLRIQWRNGSVEELLRTLAKQMGVPFKAIGELRATPPVTVVYENESMRSILSLVGRQIDREADIVLNKSQQPPVLELRFK